MPKAMIPYLYLAIWAFFPTAGHPLRHAPRRHRANQNPMSLPPPFPDDDGDGARGLILAIVVPLLFYGILGAWLLYR